MKAIVISTQRIDIIKRISYHIWIHSNGNAVISVRKFQPKSVNISMDLVHNNEQSFYARNDLDSLTSNQSERETEFQTIGTMLLRRYKHTQLKQVHSERLFEWLQIAFFLSFILYYCRRIACHAFPYWLNSKINSYKSFSNTNVKRNVTTNYKPFHIQSSCVIVVHLQIYMHQQYVCKPFFYQRNIVKQCQKSILITRREEKCIKRLRFFVCPNLLVGLLLIIIIYELRNGWTFKRHIDFDTVYEIWIETVIYVTFRMWLAKSRKKIHR